MGFFSDIAETFTGKRESAALDTQEAARKRQEKIQNKQLANSEEDRQRGIASQDKLTAGADEASKFGTQYQQGAADSMGSNAAEYMKKANSAASSQARDSSMAGARQQLMAAKSGGLSKGQAALQAGQAAGDTYSAGLESGRNQYQSATNQFQTAGATQQGLAQSGNTAAGGLAIQSQGIGSAAAQAAGAEASNLATTQVDQASASSAAGAGGISGIIGSVFSDIKLKENIKESDDDLKDLVDKVTPIDFNYKEESGEDTGKNRKGVAAQDLQKTSMKDNVIETDSGDLAIDAGQQMLSNTNLITQLATKLEELQSKIDQLQGDK